MSSNTTTAVAKIDDDKPLDDTKNIPIRKKEEEGDVTVKKGGKAADSDDALEEEDDGASTSQLGGEDGDIRDQDRLLPIANVGRIMKLAVPPSAKISKEGKEAVQECVSEFIAFVSSEYPLILSC